MQRLTFNFQSKPLKGEYSEEYETCAEIYEYFNKELKFPIIRGLARKKGLQFMRETFQTVSKSEFPHKLALFMKIVASCKIRYEN